MKRTVQIISAILVSSALVSCGTITRGSTEAVKFQSVPSGAKVTTSTGLSCTTPCEIKVSRKEKFTATFLLNGKKLTVPVNTKVAGGGTASTLGNVVAGGVIGVGVDVATGAGLDHYPNPVIVDFMSGKPKLVLNEK